MPVINILAPHVADMIAAGEVVERPASVIKELMENCFDAGARNVNVEIQGGGIPYIRVTDDGCGMAPEDAGVAFLRHATSKLRDERGLEAISTMGFRGEALAAISSISRIELTTRRKEDSEGVRIRLDAGDIQDVTPVGCPAGTSMTVRDMFYNTPARLKFMKSDRSESSACIQTALRCALGHPEVSVRFTRDGKEEFFSPGDGEQSSCIYSLLGRDMAASLLSCSGEAEGMSVSGFVSSPSAARGNRSRQYFFCNGRSIKSALLQSAVEQAYRNSLLVGRYPSCVLYLNISFGSVDVNVHPAKTEVKFSHEKDVFDLVYYAALSSLGGENRTAEVELSPATKKLSSESGGLFRSMSSESFRKSLKPEPAPAKTASVSGTLYTAPKYSSGTGQSVSRTGTESFSYSAPAALHSPHNIYETRNMSEKVEKSAPITGFKPENTPQKAVSPEIPEKPVENSVQNVESFPIADHKIVGEAMKTYIIVERGDELILIDKHAAHERVIFDRLHAQQREIMAQTLLIPVTLRCSGDEAEILDSNSQLLSSLGFEIEPYGESEYIVRAVPADMDAADVPAAVEEICDKLRSGKNPDAQQKIDEVLHTVACKAAIKAGWDTDKEELEALVQEVLSGRVKYCPHGRPVSAVITRRDLDKLFKRIV